MLISYSEQSEDIVLLRVFSDMHNGFFVDVGAGHPLRGSVTKNLVDHLGWSGINVEPISGIAEVLTARRPRDVTLACAVGAEDGFQTLFQVSEPANARRGVGLSTTQSSVANHHHAAGYIVEPVPVRTRRLPGILAEHKVDPEFDLLKIDAEGARRKLCRWSEPERRWS